jgi:CRP/FNR family transcriptional regulator
MASQKKFTEKPITEPSSIISDSLFQTILEYGSITKVKARTQLVTCGDEITMIPFVIEGRIRVFKEDEVTGREVLIYHVLNRQTCIMSIISALRNLPSKVDAITCIDSTLIFIPATLLKEWIYSKSEWKNYALDIFMNRYNELIESIESLTFDNVETRIVKLLNKHCKREGKTKIQITHQKIADLLGTTRVVVSRLLKKLENEGQIVLDRECITVL